MDSVQLKLMATLRWYCFYYYKKMSIWVLGHPGKILSAMKWSDFRSLYCRRRRRAPQKTNLEICTLSLFGLGLTTTKRRHKYWQWFAITIKVSSNNTWWRGVILFDQITGGYGHWGLNYYEIFNDFFSCCSFVNKMLHSVDLFNSHLWRMWYLHWWISVIER